MAHLPMEFEEKKEAERKRKTRSVLNPEQIERIEERQRSRQAVLNPDTPIPKGRYSVPTPTKNIPLVSDIRKGRYEYTQPKKHVPLPIMSHLMARAKPLSYLRELKPLLARGGINLRPVLPKAEEKKAEEKVAEEIPIETIPIDTGDGGSIEAIPVETTTHPMSEETPTLASHGRGLKSSASIVSGRKTSKKKIITSILKHKPVSSASSRIIEHTPEPSPAQNIFAPSPSPEPSLEVKSPEEKASVEPP